MAQNEVPDEELVQRCLRADRKAWEMLVTRYGKLVYGIASRAGLSAEESADVFQTVFLTAYRNLDLLEKPESLSFWLSTIARREAWAAKRKLTGAVRFGGETRLEELPDVPSSEPLVDAELERTERAFLVQRGLERLSDRCRRLLQFLFFEDPSVSYSEAGRRLGIPLGSVGPTRARCLERLKTVLQELRF